MKLDGTSNIGRPQLSLKWELGVVDIGSRLGGVAVASSGCWWYVAARERSACAEEEEDWSSCLRLRHEFRGEDPDLYL